MIRIGFVRHGMTNWNKEQRAQGHSDIPLNDEGRMEAEQLAKRLQNEKWDVIYASDLARAKETAETIESKMRGIVVHLDSRLREVGRGLVEGTTETERVAEWGSNWRELDLEMESADCVLGRMESVMHDITEKQSGKNVLIVSHGSFIKRMLKELFPEDNVEASLGNCSLTIVEKENDAWTWKLYNCTRHITEHA